MNQKPLDERVQIDEMFDSLDGKYPEEAMASFVSMRKDLRSMANKMLSIWGPRGAEASMYLVQALHELCPKKKDEDANS